jgi:hypothetical protein
MSLPLISVIVLNYNGKAFLGRCLDAVAAQDYGHYEVIVVDNASTDGSPAVADARTSVRLLRAQTNAGFSAGNNLGAAAARGEWLALLNSDAFPEPGWLSALESATRARPEIGLVASQMVFDARPDMVNSAGFCVDRSGVTWERHGGQPAHPPTAPVEPVFGPSAGAGLYRRSMWQETGGLREEFFMYLEDVDLGWHARWRGYEAVYAPGAVVRHMHSATVGQASPRKTYWLARNKWLVLALNYPRPYWRRYLPLIALYDVLSLAAAGLAGSWAPAWRGRRDGWRLARDLAPRGPANHFKARSEAVWSWLSPAVWPWQANARYHHLTTLGVRVR